MIRFPPSNFDDSENIAGRGGGGKIFIRRWGSEGNGGECPVSTPSPLYTYSVYASVPVLTEAVEREAGHINYHLHPSQDFSQYRVLHHLPRAPMNPSLITDRTVIESCCRYSQIHFLL